MLIPSYISALQVQTSPFERIKHYLATFHTYYGSLDIEHKKHIDWTEYFTLYL